MKYLRKKVQENNAKFAYRTHPTFRLEKKQI